MSSARPVLVGQGAAHAAPDRLTIARTGTDAAIIEVPARNDTLAVGTRLSGAVYTWSKGDPPCDPTGSTVYAGHAWRAGNGVADRWGQLRRGDVIKVAGCRFEVTAPRVLAGARGRMGSLYSVSGPARIVLVGCKADDYSKRTVVFARKIGRRSADRPRGPDAAGPMRVAAVVLLHARPPCASSAAAVGQHREGDAGQPGGEQAGAEHVEGDQAHGQVERSTAPTRARPGAPR